MRVKFRWPVFLGACASVSCGARPPTGVSSTPGADVGAPQATAAPVQAQAVAPPDVSAGDAVSSGKLGAPRTADSAGAEVTPSPAQRVYSVGRTTWIYSEPRRRDASAIGTLRVGRSLRVRDDVLIRGEGCPGGFVGVEPFGFACLDRTLSRSPNARYLAAMQFAQPSGEVLPFRYALSNGTPMYRRLPARGEWEREERFLGAPGTHRPLSIGNRGHELLAEERVVAADDDVPPFLADGGSVSDQRPGELVRRQIPLGSMLAFTRAFEHEGRTFLLAADGTLVPADRVRPFRKSAFSGVELGGAVTLPITWMRQRARPKYRRLEDGRFEAVGSEWPVRSFVALDALEPPAKNGSKTFLSTRERAGSDAVWIEESDATIVAPRQKVPWSAAEHDKWIVVSITRGTLVAYEGTRPVFATLVSPGAGGVPIRGKDPVKMSTTPLGVFRIGFKYLTDTMSPDEGDDRSFWIEDVPYTQYFNPPFALHVAYWHESFGEPMSAGCINVSPRDGRWLFQWTAPALPDGWSGVGTGKLTGKGTIIVIER